MKEYKRPLLGALWGGLCGGLLTLCSLLFLKFSGSIVTGMDMVTDILLQLRSTQICPPWLLMILLCGGIGFLWERGPKKRTRLAILLGVGALLPMLLICLCLTKLNGIYLFALLWQLLLLL